MSIPNIIDNNIKINSSQLPRHVQENKDSNIAYGKNALTFVPDFVSATDGIAKIQSSELEAQKSEKRGRPFSLTSENWIG
jgi:hypothetical protein